MMSATGDLFRVPPLLALATMVNCRPRTCSMPGSHPIGVILAIASAASWGTGDLCGGVASRRAAVFQVVALASLTGIVLIAVLALARGETFPDAAGVMWSLLAGL